MKVTGLHRGKAADRAGRGGRSPLQNRRRAVCLIATVAILATACGKAATPTPTATPTPSATPPPTATPTPTLTPTLTKTPHPTRTPSATPAQTATQTPSPSPLPPGAPTPTPTLRGVEDAPPPFDITLPEGWGEQYIQFGVLRPGGAQTDQMEVKAAFYSGQIAGATHEAVILVLWDYPTINEEVWRDGVELVGVVFDQSCQFNLVGTPPQAVTYVVGMHYAQGVPFEVRACRNEPEVAGWLVGYRRAQTNYLFYVRIAPVEGAESAVDFVQSILDTIRFPGE